MTKKSGLADSPFFSSSPVYRAPSSSVEPVVVEKTPTLPQSPVPESLAEAHFQTSRLPDSGTSRLTDQQTSSVPDFGSYRVPDYRTMRRIEVRLTLEQIRFLDDLEWELGRSLPDLEKVNLESRRITKNSIIRVLIEILRTLDLDIDASHFRNERDLLLALHQILKVHFSDSGTSRLPE